MQEKTKTIFEIESLVSNSYAHNSYLFEYFEKSATGYEISTYLEYDFMQPSYCNFISNAIPNLPTYLKPSIEEHLEIEFNGKHAEYFSIAIEHVRKRFPTNPTINHERLKPLNLVFSEDFYKYYGYPEFLGVFYATEFMCQKRSLQLYEGLIRVGMRPAELEYFKIHFEADGDHANEVIEESIEPLIKEEPELLPRVIEGIKLRLNTSGNYLKWFEEYVLTLPSNTLLINSNQPNEQR